MALTSLKARSVEENITSARPAASTQGLHLQQNRSLVVIRSLQNSEASDAHLSETERDGHLALVPQLLELANEQL
jgi:hypothetical protein